MYIIRDFKYKDKKSRYQLQYKGKISIGDLLFIPEKSMGGFFEVNTKLQLETFGKYNYEVVRFICYEGRS